MDSEGYAEHAAKLADGAGDVPSAPTCPACRGIGFLRADVPVDDPGFGKLLPCDCHAEIIASTRQARLDDLCNLLPGERALTLGDFVARGTGSATDEVLRRVRQFSVAPTGFITLWGGSGNGKSLALMALCNHFRVQGRVSVYVPLIELVEWIRAGYSDKGNDAQRRYDLVVGAYFVAVDETEKVKETEWVYEFRTRFLDRRYRMARERQAHTAFALNRSPYDIFPEHVVDRLRDASFGVELDGNGMGIPAMYENQDTSMRPSAPVPQEQLLPGVGQ